MEILARRPLLALGSSLAAAGFLGSIPPLNGHPVSALALGIAVALCCARSPKRRASWAGAAFALALLRASLVGGPYGLAGQQALAARERSPAQSGAAEHVTAENAVARRAATQPDVAEFAGPELAVPEHAFPERAGTECPVAEHASAEHAVAEHAVAEPAVAEPAVAEHASAERAAAEPAVAEPAVAERAAPRSAEADPPEPATAAAATRALEPPGAAQLGLFQPSGTRPEVGYLSPPPGAAPAALDWLACSGPPPAANEAALLLPGARRVPWCRGPFPPSDGLSLRFRCEARAQPDELVRLAPARRGWLEPALAPFHAAGERLRAWVRGRARRAAPELPPGLADALLLGETRALEPELRERFVCTGTLHLLAVSGTHLVLLGWLLADPLGHLARSLARALGLGARAADALEIGWTLAWLAAYWTLVGGQAPVQRSALALGLARVALALPSRDALRGPRRPDALSLWGLALACECALEPAAPLSLSIQLSYLATLGLALAYGPLRAALLAPCGPLLERLRVDSAGIARPWWLASAAQLALRITANGLAASAAALLATLPVVWQSIGECSPAGLVATPLATPLFAWLLLGLWGSVLLPGCLPAGALHAPCEALLALLRWIDSWPWTPVGLPQRPAWLVALATAGVLAALALRARGAPSAARWRALAQCAFALLLLPWTAGPRGLEVVALEVGHGSALALRAPGLPCLLYDAGSRERGGLVREALAPLLRSWDVARPIAVLSHEDADHADGLAWVARHAPPSLWAGACPSEIAAALPADCARLDPQAGFAEFALPRSAARLRLGRAAQWNGNEGSRWLQVEWHGRRLVLLGDAEAEGLAQMLEQVPAPGASELLLLPHHGSDTPALARLLTWAAARECWISAGERPAIAAELERRALAWSWTGRSGPLELRLPSDAPLQYP